MFDNLIEILRIFLVIFRYVFEFSLDLSHRVGVWFLTIIGLRKWTITYDKVENELISLVGLIVLVVIFCLFYKFIYIPIIG